MPRKRTPEEAYAEAERYIEGVRHHGDFELHLENWGLSALPESIGQLKQLQKLYIHHNELSALPESIGHLKQLRQLFVDDNQLTTLPESIGHLKHLQWFFANYNQLSTLPESIGQLSQLQSLTVVNNQFSALPESLLALAEAGTLRGLYLHGNDLLGIPPEIIGLTWDEVYASGYFRLPKNQRLKPQDPKRIARYWRQVMAGPVHPLNETKLLVVGPGGHGKSSLIEFLRDGTFHEGKTATDGVKVTLWHLPGGSDGTGLQLNVWDFGGQEIQYSTHEFFLTERAVYLLVFQPRDDLSTEQGLYYWLDLIHLVAPDAPVIVALSKQDEYEGIPNDLGDLKRLHPKIVDFIPVSCVESHRYAKNAYRLRELVQETVCGEVGHIRYKLPAAWMNIKAQLEQLDHDYLSFPAFQRLCGAQGVTDPEDQKLLARFLHDLGTMLNYADRIKWEDTHILKPAWVTQGVYAVALWDKLREAKGILSETMLAARLSEPEFGGQYSSEAQRFIMEMMRSFKLCYELPGTGTERRYLVPNALPEAQPEFDFDDAGALRFEIHFPRLLPTSIISRFIVAMHSQHAADKLWRLGLRSQLHGHDFVVSAHPKERLIRIAIAGQGRSRVSVLDIIRQHFAVICREKEGLEPQEYTFPPDPPGAKPYPFDSLLEAERKGVESIWLPDGVGHINVRAWLDGITDPTAREKQQTAIREAERHGGRVIYAEHYHERNDMSQDRILNIGRDANAPVNLGDGAAVGENIIQGDNNEQRIQQLAENPAQLKEEIAKLRALIAQARTAGADGDDCDNAEEAALVLEAVVEDPEKDGAKRKAKGALAILEGAAKGIKNYVEIGDNFEKVLKLVAPALGALLGTQL